jgi:hypothetical protein
MVVKIMSANNLSGEPKDPAMPMSNASQSRASHLDGESQMLTPSELNLPTLSVLATDLKQLDRYRPQEIVHKEAPPRQWASGRPDTAVKPEPSIQSSFALPISIVAALDGGALRAIHPIDDRPHCWKLQAIDLASSRPVIAYVSKRVTTPEAVKGWTDRIIELQSHRNRFLPQILQMGQHETGHAFVCQAAVDGPSLMDLQPGLHFPLAKWEWEFGHGRRVLECLQAIADCVEWLQQRDWHMHEIYPDAIRVETASGKPCLTELGYMDLLLSSNQSPIDIQRSQMKDLMDLGKLIYVMLFGPNLKDSQWESRFSIDPKLAMQLGDTQSSDVLRQASTIVLRCRHSVASQRFKGPGGVAQSLRDILDQLSK